MASLYLLIPIGLVVVAGAIGIFSWAVSSGQFDDLQSQQQRMPDDEN